MIALLTDLIKLDKFLCENIQNDNNQRLIRLGLIDAMKGTLSNIHVFYKKINK